MKEETIPTSAEPVLLSRDEGTQPYKSKTEFRETTSLDALESTPGYRGTSDVVVRMFGKTIKKCFVQYGEEEVETHIANREQMHEPEEARYHPHPVTKNVIRRCETERMRSVEEGHQQFLASNQRTKLDQQRPSCIVQSSQTWSKSKRRTPSLNQCQIHSVGDFSLLSSPPTTHKEPPKSTQEKTKDSLLSPKTPTNCKGDHFPRGKPRLKPHSHYPKHFGTIFQFGCDKLIMKIKLRCETMCGGPCKGLTTTFRFLSLVINLILLSSPCWADLTEEQQANLRRERSEAAKKWAPLIFLHPDERFFPSAIHTFLKNVVPREIPESNRPPEPPIMVPMSRSLDIQALPEGRAGEDTYLIAPIDPNCKNCPLPNFLYGTKPSSDYSPPVYATITSCLPSPQTFRSTRNTKGDPRQSRGRRFRFRKRRGRFLFRGRSKLSPMGRNFIPPNQNNYRSTPPLNSFTPPKRRFDSSSTEGTRGYFQTFEDQETLSTETIKVFPPISLPSSTLLPPRSRTLPTTEMDLEAASSSLSPYPDFSSEFSTSFVDYETRDVDASDDQSSTPTLTSSPDATPLLPDENGNTTDVTIIETAILTPSSAPPHGDNSGSTVPHAGQDGTESLKGHRFTVTYWMFYPFSQGKEVCTSRLWLLGRVFKPRLRNKCYGDLVTLNSHVGDWEHVSIYFEDGLPQRMYVSTHTYGAFYHYDPSENLFKYRGKDTRLGLPLNPKYPKIIKMDNTHPVLYAALGSHGLWGNPGIHRYESIAPLEDKTGAGTPWRTWRNIDLIDYRDPDFDRPDRQWLHFHGYWGNPASGCHRALFGTCDLASGPTGIPLKRENFPCHLPHHPTFFPKN